MANKYADPIDGYISEVSSLLPYSEVLKKPVLVNLKKDVQDAMGEEKRPPTIVFGSPIDVAKNISLAQNWGTSSASWLKRTLASIMDFSILLIVFLLVGFIQLVLLDFDIDRVKVPLHNMDFSLNFLFLSLPIFGLMMVYFIMFEEAFSTTPGKRLFGLKVVDETGIKITWSQSILRNLTKVPFLCAFLVIDFLVGILSEKTRGRNQRMLDFVAGTKVIQTN